MAAPSKAVMMMTMISWVDRPGLTGLGLAVQDSLKALPQPAQ